MLPKPEKTKKLNNNFLSDSEITKESDEVIAAKKVKSKRRMILISLICTAGLSLVFWTIKGVQSFIENPQQLSFNFHPNLNFKLPSINFTPINTSSSNISANTLDKFLSTKKWSVVILNNKNLSQPIYKSNYPDSDINDFVAELSKLKAIESSKVVSGLPEGILFQEKLNASSTPYTYGTIITLPSSKLIFIIKDSSNSATFSQDISQFINSAYWYSISQN
jgi:hypothetical protein